jgi:hypothetical protein
MDEGVMGGLLLPGHLVLKGVLWAVSGVATAVPSILLSAGVYSGALSLGEALTYGLRTTAFTSSILNLIYFIISNQQQRERPADRLKLLANQQLAISLLSASHQVRADPFAVRYKPSASFSYHGPSACL